MTTIAVVSNLSPVITLIIGVTCLKETASVLDVICVLMSFVGVSLMTYGVVLQKEKIEDMDDDEK